MPKVAFITGTGRSGTNITKDILSKHTKVASLPFEHRFTIDPGGIIDFYRGVKNWSPYLADFKLKQLEFVLLRMVEKSDAMPYAAWELEKWIPGFKSFIHELMQSLIEVDYPASYPGKRSWLKPESMYYYRPNKEEIRCKLSRFLNQCHQSILNNQEREVFVEDNTWSMLFASELLDLVKGSKLIHVVRDPRDVISSLLKQKWTPSGLDDILIYYKDVMNTWQSQKKNLSKEKFIEIRMEDLLAFPVKTMEIITSFLDIEFEPEIVNLDLSKGNQGRYKTTFSLEDQKKINISLKDYLNRYNYN